MAADVEMKDTVQLGCGVYGDGTTFFVEVPRSASVADVQEAIFHKKRYGGRYSFSASDLTLRLARKEGEEWLQGNQDAIHLLQSRHIDEEYKQMVPLFPLFKNESGQGCLEAAFKPRVGEIHVLVELPTEPASVADEDVMEVHEVQGDRQELQYYQQQGKTISTNCVGYCKEILRKIDELYASEENPLPFICVEGSSGMGKTQLAFALEGHRPWFYWIATPIGTESQPLYKNFSSLSEAFSTYVTKDNLMAHPEEAVLRTLSGLYVTTKLWTYGFIRALLEYCSSEECQKSQMIRFDESFTLNVKKCNSAAVWKVIKEMKEQKKKLPFFVLDEMTANDNIESGGMSRAAFQRNVFRACGLVVIIMGTDSKISNLVDQSAHSSTLAHRWVSVVPRFPPYQIMLHSATEREAWERVVEKYPVVKDIVRKSRGRFARCFLDEVVKYANDSGDVKLCDLLNKAFECVCEKAQMTKHYMRKFKGRFAQLVAISFTNSMNWPSDDDECAPPPGKKQKRDGTFKMHLHFANLVDERLTDVILSDKKLSSNDKPWTPKCCYPDIEDDLLLYLAVLGGKKYSSYHDYDSKVAHSTKSIFMEQLRGAGFSVHENSHAVTRDFKMFENMVAHAIFCASRRNGVQGIPFNDFFTWLLGEFRDESTAVEMTEITRQDGSEMKRKIVGCDLFDGYSVHGAVENMVIPFLAPPNAVWPKFILDTEGHGCYFGHLIRACNADRCDVYIRCANSKPRTALFLCECKHWGRSVDRPTMEGIIRGLTDKWKWQFALVFCERLANFQDPSKLGDVGCVRIDCQNGNAFWVNQPLNVEPKQLVIVMETGRTGLPPRK